MNAMEKIGMRKLEINWADTTRCRDCEEFIKWEFETPNGETVSFCDEHAEKFANEELARRDSTGNADSGTGRESGNSASDDADGGDGSGASDDADGDGGGLEFDKVLSHAGNGDGDTEEILREVDKLPEHPKKEDLVALYERLIAFALSEEEYEKRRKRLEDTIGKAKKALSESEEAKRSENIKASERLQRKLSRFRQFVRREVIHGGFVKTKVLRQKEQGAEVPVSIRPTYTEPTTPQHGRGDMQPGE